MPGEKVVDAHDTGTTAARPVTFTIATQAFTAGRIIVYLEYVV